jgi:hypothetical protein
LFLLAPKVSLDLDSDATTILLANAQRMRVLGAADLAASHIHELQRFHSLVSAAVSECVVRLGPKDVSFVEKGKLL